MRRHALALGALALASLGASPALASDGPATAAVDGTVRVVVADTPQGSERFYSIETDDGEIIPVDLPPTTPANAGFTGEIETGDAPTVDEPATVVESEIVPRRVRGAVAPTEHRAYIAVMTNRGTGTAPTASGAVTVVEKIGDYWEAQSDGAVSDLRIAAPAVSYASTISKTDNSTCGVSEHNALWAEAAAKFPGVSFTDPGNHLIVMVNTSCTVGLGTIGSSLADGGKIIMSLPGAAESIGAHELGHNVGLDHANFQSCDGCAGAEYGDLFSVMGVSTQETPPALDTPYRVRLGLTTPAEVMSVQATGGPASRTMHLAPRSATSGLRGLEVVDPASGQTYYVEYRSGTGTDAGSAYAGGRSYQKNQFAPGVTVATLRTVNASPSGPYAGSIDLVSRKVVGGVPQGSYGIGDSFATAGGSVRIAVDALAGAGGADVTVTFPQDVVVVPSAPAPAPAPTPEPLPAPVLQSLSAATPRITGTARVGRTLKVKVGTWSPRPAFRYQWYAGGTKISSKGTKTSFRLTTKQKGKRITVRVTATKPGYATVTTSSKATRKIVKK